jgi:hypothetical protein
VQRNFNCPACKRSLDHVICTFTEEVTIPVTSINAVTQGGQGSNEKGNRRGRGNKDKDSKEVSGSDVNVAPVTAIVIAPKPSFEDYQIWGDQINEAYYMYDSRSQMFVPKFYYDEIISKLWDFKCRLCHAKRKDSKELRGHYFGEHKMHMCLLCIEFKQVFPSEQHVYNQQEYERHLRQGDQDGCNGHPNCEFCKKRFYDSTALFGHLARDHYSCHVCTNHFGVKFRYMDQYKDLESHYRKEHYFCEEPGCVERRFVCFATDVELLTHRIQYHPHLADKNRCIPIQFKYKNGGNNSNKSTATDAENKTDESSSSAGATVSKSSKFEGGIGGRVANGEWQVEFEGIIADPRDPNRNILREDIPLAVTAASSAPIEDFPQLPSSGPSPVLITNKWINLKEKKSFSKQNAFPALPSQPKKPSALEVFAPAKATAAPARKPSAVVTSTSNAPDYFEDYAAISGIATGAKPAVSVVESLGSWANIKVDKRAQKKKSKTVEGVVASTGSSTPSEEPTSPIAMEPSASEKNNPSAKTSSSIPTAAAIVKGGTSNKNMPEWNNYDDFSVDMQRALTESFNDFTTAKSPSSVEMHEKMEDAYPTLQATVASTTTKAVPTPAESASVKSNKVSLPQKKAQPAAVSSDWSEALKAVGMTATMKKKTGITVIKAQKTDADKKLVIPKNSRSIENLVSAGSTFAPGWKSSTFVPSPPPVMDDYESNFYAEAFPPPPPPGLSLRSSTSSKTTNSKQEEFNIHKHSGWVTMGGAGNSGKSTTNNNSVRDLADFPTLSTSKR